MFDDLVGILLFPGYVFTRIPQHNFFWLYLASAALLAIVACLRGSEGPFGTKLLAAAAKVFDPKVLFHRSAVVDYQFVALNYLLSIAELGLGIAGVQTVAQTGSALLEGRLGPSPDFSAGLWVEAALTLAMVVASDFGNFYFHWLQHRIPSLWELHKVHHSAEVLTPLTALRVHPLAEILGTQFVALCMGVPAAAFLYAFHGRATEFTVLGVNVVVFFWHTILGNHLQHSHVWVMYPKYVRAVFNSPALHLIHHSADPKHRNKNLGFTFTVWDRIAGTLYQPTDAERHGLTLGIAPRDMAELRTVGQLYWTPVRNIGRRMRKRMGRFKPRQTGAGAETKAEMR